MRNLPALTLLLLLLLPSIKLYPDSNIGTITVSGFINLGDRKDNNINTELTKSLIISLKKNLSKTLITGYSEVKNYSLISNFWDSRSLNIDIALSIARYFRTDILVTGDYLVDDYENTVFIKASIYDVKTGKLLNNINYNGMIGFNLFDTIDAIDSDITGLLTGNNISSGNNIVKVQNTKNSYDVYINGANSWKISNSINFYSNTNTVEKYNAVTNIASYTVFHYEKSIPWMNIMLPGFAEFQASDLLMGTIFSIAGAGGAGLTVISILGYNSIESRYSTALNYSEGPLYSNYASQWLWLMAGGVVLWASSAGLSTVHAYYMVNQETNIHRGADFSIDCNPTGSVVFSINMFY